VGELLTEAEATAGRYDDGEAVAILVLAATEINREIEAGNDKDRVRRLVDRLQRVGREVAERSGAHVFSISAGLPVGVSVTVEWDVSNS
jgi:hypothetical protein